MCNMHLLSQAFPPSQMKNPNRKFNENKLLELRTFQFLICPVLQANHWNPKLCLKPGFLMNLRASVQWYRIVYPSEDGVHNLMRYVQQLLKNEKTIGTF
jgi:hypothetical protein